jgi:hypothetical protein
MDRIRSEVTAMRTPKSRARGACGALADDSRRR